MINITMHTGVSDNNDVSIPVYLSFGHDNDPDYYEFSGGGPHEEGFSYWHRKVSVNWERRELVMEITTNSCDCDGPLDTYWKGFLPFDKVKNFAVFETRSQSQRDHFAEAMGY